MGKIVTMVTKYRSVLFLIFLLVAAGIYINYSKINSNNDATESTAVSGVNSENEGGPDPEPHPLSIEALRKGEYPGSDIVIEQTLDSGSNYKRYIASYKSEGLKIYGLLTIPSGPVPRSPEGEVGWPVVIF